MHGLKIISVPTKWNSIVNKLKEADIYYAYDYANLFAQQEKGVPLAAYLKKGNTKLFYPFIKREIPSEEGVYDIVTPYGYGGPYIEGEDKEIVEEFTDQFTTYCLANKILTETIRFHPLAKNANYHMDKMDIRYIRKTTAVDLSCQLECIRSNYGSMNKRNIRKAKKGGVTCYVAEPSSDNINIFNKLYKETMDRNNAANFYYFEDDYFNKQMQPTNISETYLLFASYYNKVIAGTMVIVGKQFAHYHLGASKSEYLHVRPNNVLFDYMIQFCKEKGSSFLHLGGGYEENDGLFQFKTSFTNNCNFDYYIGTRVFNQQKYNQIASDVRKKYKVNENYFPIYRGIIEPKLLKVER